MLIKETQDVWEDGKTKPCSIMLITESVPEPLILIPPEVVQLPLADKINAQWIPSESPEEPGSQEKLNLNP